MPSSPDPTLEMENRDIIKHEELISNNLWDEILKQKGYNVWAMLKVYLKMKYDYGVNQVPWRSGKKVMEDKK